MGFDEKSPPLTRDILLGKYYFIRVESWVKSYKGLLSSFCTWIGIADKFENLWAYLAARLWIEGNFVI